MISSVNSDNIEHLLPLVRAYQDFYHVADICDQRNRSFFGQFSESSPLGCQFLYYVNNQPVAFATIYFCFASSITAKVAIMNDLYTHAAHRGQGIAKALVEHCHQFALSRGALRLQWTTALDNQPAQRLYDGLSTNKSTWHFYSYSGEK